MGIRKLSTRNSTKISPQIVTRAKSKRKAQLSTKTSTNIRQKKSKKGEKNTLNTSIKESNNLNANMTTPEPKLDILLQHLPAFDGRKENNIHFYIRQFDEVATAASLTDALKIIILKAKFTGQARETLINSPELNDETDYQQLKLKLSAEFENKKSLEEVQQDFDSLKQRPDQSIDEFSKIFKLKALKYIQKTGHNDKPDALNLFDAIKLNKFLKMIRPDIAFEVQKAAPRSLDDAIKIAKQYENAYKFCHKEQLNNMQTKSELDDTLMNITTSHIAEIDKLKKEIEALKLGCIETKPKQTKFCHICQTATHDTINCFYNMKNNNTRATENFKRSRSPSTGKYVQNFHANTHSYQQPRMPQMPSYSGYNSNYYPSSPNDHDFGYAQSYPRAPNYYYVPRYPHNYEERNSYSRNEGQKKNKEQSPRLNTYDRRQTKPNSQIQGNE